MTPQDERPPAVRVPFEQPFERFGVLLEKARAAGFKDHNQCWLGTVDARGRPQVRVVLLKAFDPRGFVFYTNYESDKARALEVNPHAALNFYWPELGEQVRVEGGVARVSSEESDAYFASRPLPSRIGAWASDQSRPLGSRLELDARVAKLAVRYALGNVPRPPHWGGYRVTPDRLEFWRAHPFRLHHRERFDRDGDGWQLNLLYP